MITEHNCNVILSDVFKKQWHIKLNIMQKEQEMRWEVLFVFRAQGRLNELYVYCKIL
jgi:hypothetical protein